MRLNRELLKKLKNRDNALCVKPICKNRKNKKIRLDKKQQKLKNSKLKLKKKVKRLLLLKNRKRLKKLQ